MAKTEINATKVAFEPIQITHTIESAEELAMYLWAGAALSNPQDVFKPAVVKWLGKMPSDSFDGRDFVGHNDEILVNAELAAKMPAFFNQMWATDIWDTLSIRLMEEKIRAAKVTK